MKHFVIKHHFIFASLCLGISMGIWMCCSSSAWAFNLVSPSTLAPASSAGQTRTAHTFFECPCNMTHSNGFDGAVNVYVSCGGSVSTSTANNVTIPTSVADSECWARYIIYIRNDDEANYTQMRNASHTFTCHMYLADSGSNGTYTAPSLQFSGSNASNAMTCKVSSKLDQEGHYFVLNPSLSITVPKHWRGFSSRQACSTQEYRLNFRVHDLNVLGTVSPNAGKSTICNVTHGAQRHTCTSALSTQINLGQTNLMCGLYDTDSWDHYCKKDSAGNACINGKFYYHRGSSLLLMLRRDSVTYTKKANGGYWTLSSGETTTANQTFTRICDSDTTIAKPKRTGYSFAGWTLSCDDYAQSTLNENTVSTCCNYASSATRLLNLTEEEKYHYAQATLTAQWKANTYPVTYVLHNGTNVEGYEVYQDSATYDSTYKINDEAFDAVIDKGYISTTDEIDGWYIDEACSIPYTAKTYTTDGPLTLHAQTLTTIDLYRDGERIDEQIVLPTHNASYTDKANRLLPADIKQYNESAQRPLCTWCGTWFLDQDYKTPFTQELIVNAPKALYTFNTCTLSFSLTARSQEFADDASLMFYTTKQCTQNTKIASLWAALPQGITVRYGQNYSPAPSRQVLYYKKAAEKRGHKIVQKPYFFWDSFALMSTPETFSLTQNTVLFVDWEASNYDGIFIN